MWPVSLLIPVAAFLFLTGCQIDSLEPEHAPVRDSRLVIQATYEVPEFETKTVRDDAAKIYWTPGDAISLFYGSGTDGGSKFVALAEEVSLTTNFSGTITAVTGGADIGEADTYFWGLYPYDETSSCDGQTITMSIPSIQPGMEGTFAPGYAPSLGHSQGLMLSFRNIWSGFGFTVSEPGYQVLTFRGNNGESLAGRAKIGVDGDGLPYVDQILDGIQEVSLTAPTAEGFVPGEYYYMQFFPITLESGFTVEISNKTQTGIYIYSNSMTFSRSKWNRAKNVDTRCTSFIERKVTRADFEDPHFANYVFSNFDWDNNGELSVDERNSVNYIGVRTDSIASLRGVEFFSNLLELSCNGVRKWNNQTHQYEFGNLTSLDLSGNPKLRYLSCYYNQLTTLDLSENTALQNLYCYYNQLTTLDLSENTALQYLSCYDNQLTALDVSKNTALMQLYCSYNQFSTLDVSNNTELRSLEVNGLGLSSLDLSHNTKLTSLYCSSNNLTSVDVSVFPDLTSLNVSYNPLSSFDISNNSKLTYLGCDGLSLTTLDVSHLTQLYELDCNNNKLTALDLSQNSKLRYFFGESNLFTTLDFRANPLMEYVYCGNNKITDLDLSENAALKYLYCFENQLTELDVSGIASLYVLSAQNNPLETLYVFDGQTIQNEYLPDGVTKVVRQLDGIAIDESSFPDPEFRAWVSTNCDLNGDGKLSKPERMGVSSMTVSTNNIVSLEGIGYFTNLTSLYCNGSRDYNTGEVLGQLASLDLTDNINLQTLRCYCNQLTTLDLSHNTSLESLYCYSNKLTSLDVSKNIALRYLYCYDNQLTNLDVSKSPDLQSLYCYVNQLSALSVSNNTGLLYLDCESNQLSSLDVSKNSALVNLDCGGNLLTSLDLSKNVNLQSLYCSYNQQLISLDFSNNLKLTYIYASGCISLQSVLLPETIPTISSSAFRYCSSLKKLVVPASVTSIGSYAFQGCTDLESVTLRPTTPPTGGYRMFYNTTCPIYVPAISVDAYKTADYWSDYYDRIQAVGDGDNEDIGYDEW